MILKGGPKSEVIEPPYGRFVNKISCKRYRINPRPEGQAGKSQR